MLLGDVNNLFIFTDHVLISKKKNIYIYIYIYIYTLHYYFMDNQWRSGWHNLNTCRVESKSAAES